MNLANIELYAQQIIFNTEYKVFICHNSEQIRGIRNLPRFCHETRCLTVPLNHGKVFVKCLLRVSNDFERKDPQITRGSVNFQTT